MTVTRIQALAFAAVLACLMHDSAARVTVCAGEGERLSAKAETVRCCPGLTRIEAEKPVQALLPGSPETRMECRREGPPDIKICTACGDGRCGVGENRCNCPRDCSKDPAVE